MQVSNFTPYIYSGSLDSFEFTVADPAYVAVSATVGNTQIPFQYMTRLPDASGGVRIHVDINSTPVNATSPLVVTLLSARTGAPVCALVVAMDLGAGAPAAPAPATTQPTTPAPAYTAPATYAPTTYTQPTPAPTAAVSASGSAAATSATSATVLRALCSSAAGAYRLWLILLIAYALLVGGLLWLEFPLAWTWAKTPERVAAIILIALIALLAFWYLSASCRAALWMPLLAFLIAVLGLLAAFWNHPRVSQLLLLEQKTTIVTPPPTKK